MHLPLTVLVLHLLLRVTLLLKDLENQVTGDDWKIQIDLPATPAGTYWFTLKDSIDENDPGDLQVNTVVVGTPTSLVIAVPHALTSNLTPKTYRYDIQKVTSSGIVTTLYLGKVKVVRDITRSIA